MIDLDTQTFPYWWEMVSFLWYAGGAGAALIWVGGWLGLRAARKRRPL